MGILYNDISAQSMSVNSSGDLPDGSAMLDVKSTTKGVLISRMTLAQKAAIASPADGLMIYQTNGAIGLYIYNGTTGAWMQVLDSNSVAALIVAAEPNIEDVLVKGSNAQSDSLYNLSHLSVGTATVDSAFRVVGGASIDVLSINDEFKFPLIDGGANQVMKTDGLGNLSWTNLDDGDWVKSGGLLYNTTDRLIVGNSTLPASYFSEFETPASANYPIGLSVDQNYSGAAQQFGLVTDLATTSTGEKYGVYNNISANASQPASNGIFGTYNKLSANGSGESFGTYSLISMPASATGKAYGNYIDFAGASTANRFGFYIDNEKFNFISGKLGIGREQASAPLHIAPGIGTDFQTNGIYVNNENSASNAHSYVTVRTEENGGTPIYSLDINNKGGFALAMNQVDTSLNFYLNPNATGTKALTLTRFGEVGIGTSTPDSLFTVNGSARINTLNINNTFTLPNTTGNIGDALIYTAAGTVSWQNPGDNLGNHTATTNLTLGMNFISRDGDSEGIAIDASGNMSITGTSLGTVLSLNGFVRTSGQGSGIEFTNDQISITGNNGNSGDMRFETGAANRMIIQSGGNVGIGTLTPSSKLDVAGDVEVTSANAFYLGDPTVNGTWRIIRSGNNLSFERLEGGSWVAKTAIIP